MKLEKPTKSLIQDLSKITKKILISDIFYGLFLGTIEKKASKDIPLAAVSLNKGTMEFGLLINPDEWFKFSDEVKYGVLRHEAMHLTNFHLLTNDAYPDSKRDNYATDLFINQMIPKEQLPSWGIFIEDFEKKYPRLNWKKNAGRDHYYKELGKLSEEEKKELDMDEKCEHNWVIVDGDGEKCNKPLTKSEKDAMRVQVESTIENLAEEIAKSQGHVPAEISALIGNFVKPKPKFNYAKYIRNYVGNSTRYTVGSTKVRENHRFPGMAKVILKPISRMLVLIDESGSVSEKELHDFLNEIHHLRRKTDIEIRPFDTGVMDPVKYNGQGVFERTNCGGTDFDAAVDYFNKCEFQTCIIFTDGYAGRPRPTNKRLLWVISSNGDTSSVDGHADVIKIPSDQ